MKTLIVSRELVNNIIKIVYQDKHLADTGIVAHIEKLLSEYNSENNSHA